jgi:4-amino-4-deoxy-L-arabinose transferase-like glycosyltransferase
MPPAIDRLTRWIAAALAAVAAASLFLAFRPAALMPATPFTEDSFYSMAVARNVANGVGVTIDGAQPTNGFQPLFTFLQAGLFWIAGDDATALRLSVLVSWLLFVATIYLVGSLARDALPDDDSTARGHRFWVAAMLYGGGFLTFMHHFNGLETGAVLFCYAGIARLWQLGRFERPGGSILLGAALGLTVLTRIDAAFFVAVVCGYVFLSRVREAPLQAFARAFVIGASAVAISSPWWTFNWVEFGSFMPTSGTAQQEWGIYDRRLRWVFWALANCFFPTLWTGKGEEVIVDGLMLSILRAVVFIGAVYWARKLLPARLNWGQLAPQTQRSLEFAGLMAAAFGLLALYYGFSFIAYWFYYRYLFPVAIPASVAMSLLLVATLRRRPEARVWLRYGLPLLALPTFISAIASTVAPRSAWTLHLETVYWEQLELIAEQVPATDVVAAGQSGTLGYFRDRVINADGKVNRSAIPYQTRMWDYLKENDVRWFCDWPYYVEKYLGKDPAANGWRHVGQKGYWQLWRRDPG